MPTREQELESTYGSPQWWRKRLLGDLRNRSAELQRYDDYYSGKQRMAFATSKFREAFGSLFERFADNWCDLVVDAVEERLNVQGFRMDPNDTAADDGAHRIWQENNLDAGSQIGHTESLINGEAAVMVWRGPNADSSPLITVEHPRQVIVATDPANRRIRRAALKHWKDDAGYLRVNVYLPDGIYRWRSEAPAKTDGSDQATTWRAFSDRDSDAWPIANPYGVVPVIPLPNRPRLLTTCESEIRKVIPVQDAVNKLCTDLLVASEFVAFPQRYIIGVEIPTDPETNQETNPLKYAVDRLWMLEGGGEGEPEPKIGQLGAADLTNYTGPIELFVQHIASQTRTPPHYFYLRGQFPSGESIKSAETGLVAKTRRKMRHYGEAWEDVIRLAFLIANDREKANAMQAETVWGDPESRSESEHTDALVKQQALGIPDEMLWEEAGFTPAQIQRIKLLREQQRLVEARSSIPPQLPGGVSPNGNTPAEPVPVSGAG